MRNIVNALNERVLLTDGPVSRALDMARLDVARDFYGDTATTAILNLTRPNLIRDIHINYLNAGADIIRTNSLDISPLSLKGSSLADEAFILNYKAAEIASEAVDAVAGNGRRRFVLGLIRDTGWTATPAEIAESIELQAEALLSGGADGLLLDCLAGIGRIQPMVAGAKRAMASQNCYGAALFLQQSRDGADVDFSSHILSQVNGIVRYRPGFAKSTGSVAEWIEKENVNLIGGGDSMDDTARTDSILRHLAEDRWRPYQNWKKELNLVDEFAPVSSWRAKSHRSSYVVPETV